MHRQHVPAVGPQELGDIEILLVPGKTVEDDSRRMSLRAGGEIEDAQQLAAVARNHHLARGGRRRDSRLWCLTGKRQREYRQGCVGGQEFHRINIRDVLLSLIATDSLWASAYTTLAGVQIIRAVAVLLVTMRTGKHASILVGSERVGTLAGHALAW